MCYLPEGKFEIDIQPGSITQGSRYLYWIYIVPNGAYKWQLLKQPDLVIYMHM